MNYTMLVTTFSGDIQQFRMFCYCLNKNWEGQRKLTVCLGNGDDQEMFTNITKEYFDTDWHIEIKPTIYSYKSGESEQQVNAVYYSIQTGVDDVIIWDCKDFLLRPCNYSTFKKNGKYRVTYLLRGQKLINMGYNLDGLVDQPIDRYTAISNIRPWMWNVQQLTRYWNRMNERFGDYRTWKVYPAGNEIYGYHIYTLQDPDRLVEYLTHKEMPLLFGGGWTHQTYDGILKEATYFDQNPERIVWKHSRKLADPRCLDVTRSVLIKYGIDQQFIDQVYG
jgi:hypothetical protein